VVAEEAAGDTEIIVGAVNGLGEMAGSPPILPEKIESLKAVTFLNRTCISAESHGRRLIEETEISFLLERAYPSMLP
jgi:hypothetical protein